MGLSQMFRELRSRLALKTCFKSSAPEMLQDQGQNSTYWSSSSSEVSPIKSEFD